MPDRALAAALARALEGEPTPDGEAADLARALRSAADAARTPVTADELERAFGAVHGRLAAPRRRRRRIAVAVAGLAVAAALAAALLLTGGGGGRPVDVQAGALDALGRYTALEVVERVRPGPRGGFATSIRRGWLGPGGLARWTQTEGGRVVAETRVAGGRVIRYRPADHTALIASSCGAFATGCVEATDPVASYRAALLAATPGGVHVVRSGDTYVVTLPVQTLPGAVRVVQRAILDAGSLLPTRIVWSERGLVTAVIDVLRIRRLPADRVPERAFALHLPARVRVIRIGRSGAARVTTRAPLTPAAAAALRPPPLWLGRRYARRPARLALLRAAGGRAVLARYGPVTVWSYTGAAPRALAANAGVPLKPVVIGGRQARIYSSRTGALVIEVDRGAQTVAIVAPTVDKLHLFAAVRRLRPV